MWFPLPAPPNITHLRLTYGSIFSTLTCISTGSPATNVTWMRDGQPLTIDGSTYQLTQTVANRRLSTYENVLSIDLGIADIIGSIYNCTVMNALGRVSNALVACKCTCLCECSFSSNLGYPYTNSYCIEVCLVRVMSQSRWHYLQFLWSLRPSSHSHNLTT